MPIDPPDGPGPAEPAGSAIHRNSSVAGAWGGTPANQSGALALTEACRGLEAALPGSRCAVLLRADDGSTPVAIAPSLPPAEAAGLAGLLPTGPVAAGPIAVVPVGSATIAPAADEALPAAGNAWVIPLGADAAIGHLLVLPPAPRKPNSEETAVVREAADRIALLARLHQAETALAEVEARYRTLVGQVPGIVYVEARDGNADLFISPQSEAVLGYSPAELVAGAPAWMDLIHPDDRPRVDEAVRRSNADEAPFDEEYRMVGRGGDVVWVRNQAVIVRADDGEPRFWHGVATDLTAQRDAERRLAHLAHHDGLTGLPNRALFTTRLAAAIAAARDRGDTGVAVLFVDLDGFKNLNDGLGHDIGDRVLAEAGARLRARLGPADTLARFGGDEFVALLEGVAGPDAAAAVADDLLDALRAPLVVDGCATRVTASVGIALLDGAGGDPADLLRQADVALYEAKAAGRATHAVYAPALSLPVLTRDRWESDLRQAMVRGELVLHFQPEIDLATGRITRLEALVRWNHPRLGLLHPANFVRLAEETGLIVPLGRWVLREACRQVRAWQQAGGEPIGVSVNLSAREFCRVALADEIEAVLAETGLPPHALELHVGEAAAAVAPPEAVRRLRDLGVRVAIDDFGKAYPSLAGLQGLAVDALRLDRSFVANLGHDPRSRALVRAIAALGRDAELAVSAKGVETEHQVAILRTLGVGLGQGFALARPMDPTAIEAWLAAGVGAPIAAGASGGTAP